MELYRPSNATEGDSFMARFCDRCTKSRGVDPCPIQADTMCFDVDEPEYPREWIVDEDGARCTAFEEVSR